MLLPFSVESYREWEQRRDHAWITYLLIAICIVCHILVSTLPPERRLDIYFRFGVVKFTPTWYGWLTCTLLHAGWVHLVGNMFFLWVYGVSLEKFLGRTRFLVTYVLGALVSVSVHLITLPDSGLHLPTVGASGAISAVLGAFFVLLPKARIKCALVFFLRPLIATLPAWIVLALWFLMQVYFSADPNAASRGVAFWAHVGGFFAGAVLGALWARELKRQHRKKERLWRQPLENAWQLFWAGNYTKAWQLYQTFQEHTAFPGPDRDVLLETLLGLKEGRLSAEQVFKAMGRLDTLLRPAEVVMLYQELIKTIPPEKIPAAVHRQAGKNALSCGQAEPALRAFSRAMEQEPDLTSPDNRDILKRSEAAARYKLKNPALADRIASLQV